MELLTAAQTQAADQFAENQNIALSHLMQQAGQHVAEAAERWAQGPKNIMLVAGPGNNGGDAFVAAALLKARHYPITLYFYGSENDLSPAAAIAAKAFKDADGQIHPLQTPNKQSLEKVALIIDGLIGTGLSRPLTGELRAWVKAINESQKPVIAIDIPTGINADTGEIMGTAIKAQQTVSFFRAKPGHFLYPGKAHIGRLSIQDIGIPNRSLKHINCTHWRNNPSLWQSDHHTAPENSHKYNKGSVLVIAGQGSMPGATTLAANAALRGGAGLVTLAHDKKWTPTNLYSAVIEQERPEKANWQALIKARKITTILFGPGAKPDEQTRQTVLEVLKQPCQLCLDAGALTAFEDNPDQLVSALQKARKGPVILTPHQGEFDRLFVKKQNEAKVNAVKQAAHTSGAVIVLKGADTIIAAPTGEVIINDNAPKTLATAGTGDVLAGLIAANCAKAMPPLAAAASAVYLHGEAANRFSHDLIADDLLATIPKVRAQLKI